MDVHGANDPGIYLDETSINVATFFSTFFLPIFFPSGFEIRGIFRIVEWPYRIMVSAHAIDTQNTPRFCIVSISWPITPKLKGRMYLECRTQNTIFLAVTK